MFDIRGKINFIVYVLFLFAAIFLVYKAFTVGFNRGEFDGKYYPPEEGGPPETQKEEVFVVNYLEPTDSLLLEGRKLFNLNCASCHGDDGQGNGPKAAGLNPPPRNFINEKFKYGASFLQILNTINNGVPGTSMPAFDLLPKMQRIAMAHYVQTFVPNPPENPQELVDALPKPAVGAEEQVVAPADTAAKEEPLQTIEITKAKELVLAERATRPDVMGSQVNFKPSRLYDNFCASCHGENGMGKAGTEHVAPSSVIYLETGIIAGNEEVARMSRQEFEKFLTTGSPGLFHHNFSRLSRNEISQLYNHIIGLAESR